MRSRSAWAVGLFFVLAAAATFAQVISTAQIRGTVQDPSGAAVAGATITLTQTSTGAVRTTASASDGTYSLPDLPIGPYRLEVTQAGFTKYVQTGIVLQVGGSPTINVTLQVGAVTQEVQVSANAAMVQTQNEGVGEVTPPQQVQELPLNGRQVTDLLSLAGAVGQGRAFRASYPSSAVISIAGGAQGSVAYWLDGGTHNDPLSNQNLPLPFPDTVEEFKVETSSLPAQYGTHPSGSVNVVTKSGTNSFHGDVFEYVKNYMFDSRNTSFATASPADYPFLPTAALKESAALAASPRDNLKRNQFGGTVGGPIKKDKLFFFLGWQDTIQRQTSANTVTLPTDAMIGGDFTAYAANCSPGPLALGAPFGTGTAADGATGPNVTSASNISHVILALEQHIPVPSAVTDPCGTYTFQNPEPQTFTENQGLARIDFRQSNKNSLFGSYFVTNWNQPPAQAEKLPNGNLDLLVGALDGASNRVQSLTLGDTYLISSNMVNSVHLTGNRSRNLTLQNSTVDLPTIIGEAAPEPGTAPINLYEQGPPKFPSYMANIGTGGFGGLFNSTPSLQPYDTIEVSDDLAWTHGAHQLSFGVDFINLRAFATNYLFNQGDFTFDGSHTGASVWQADYVLGETSLASGYSQDAPIPSIQHQNVFAIYAQDAWKITRRLTVTAGLRWDPFFGHTDPKGHVVNINLTALANNVHSKLYPSAPAGYFFNGDPGGPSNNKLTNNDLNKWSPRIGLAWDPRGDGRMAIRAGFGIFYDFPNFSYDQFGFEEPYGGAVAVPGASYGTGAGDVCNFPCSTDLTDPWITEPTFTANENTLVLPAGTNPFGGGPGSGTDYVGQGPAISAYLPNALVFSYPQNIKPTYVMQYNLSVEKQVGKDWLLSITYLGSQQRHLWGNNEANPSAQGPCPPGYPIPGYLQPCVPGPCPSFLPPFVCGSPSAPAPWNDPADGLSNNRLLAKYNAPAAGGVGPQGGDLYGETLLLEEGGTGNYNGLLISAQHQFGNHFTSTTNYTWSHCISDNYTTTLGFFLAAEAVPFDPKADRSNCPNADTHNIFNESLVAESPEFSGHLKEMLLGHWGFSLSIIAQSGTDINSPSVVLDFSGNGNGPTGGLDQRPDLVGNPYCQPKGRTCWLAPASYAAPAPYTFGDLGANSLFGPGSIIVNTGLWRDFQITERQKVEFKWEVFNLPNHANLYLPSGIGAGLPIPTFGQPAQASTAGLGALNQTSNDPRTMQFSLKYSF
jgi:Carboxypeptidase regulatory-like domain/TonB dependent receptor-like, beta-barrel